jgi:hypothetical protein
MSELRDGDERPEVQPPEPDRDGFAEQAPRPVYDPRDHVDFEHRRIRPVDDGGGPGRHRELERAIGRLRVDTQERFGPPVDEDRPTTRYSGELIGVSKRDADADALAERIDGLPRVRFDSDPSGREFDAVSDEFVGQSKPANYVFNKAGRAQAKATFDCAKETGRDVYYHFDGDPDSSVISRLEEYAQRYGVELHIDTTPFQRGSGDV